MLTCDGLKEKLEAMSDLDIYQSAIKLFTSFEPEVNLRLLENLGHTRLTIQQYCQLIGRLRLYQDVYKRQAKRLCPLAQIVLFSDSSQAVYRTDRLSK